MTDLQVIEGGAAEEQAAELVRKSQQSALEGLPARAKENAEAAFDSLVLDAAASLETDTPSAWFKLKREMTAALKEGGSSFKEWERAINIQKRARKDEIRKVAPASLDPQGPLVVGEHAHDRSGFGYEMTPGAIARDGRFSEKIAGFSAVIQRERVVHDGAESQREYTIEALVGDETKVLTCSAKEFHAMTWVPAHLGARAWIGPGKSTLEEVRVAIQRLSGEIPIDHAYAFVGWRQHRSTWQYHHAGGAIGEHGVIEECVPAPLPLFASRFVLPPPPEGEALITAVRAAADCFAIHGSASIAIMSLVWRSILGPTLASIHIAGEPGSGKTELASIAQRHFGAGMNIRALPMTWQDASDAFLARARNTLGDCIGVIDDLLLLGRQNAEKMVDRVDHVFRGSYAGQGQARMNREGAYRADRPPRSAILSTGEMVPAGFSLRQRVFLIDLARSPISYRPAMKAASSGLLAQATSAFIRWVAPSMDAVRKGLERRDAESAKAFGTYSDRTCAVTGALLVGAEAFYRFAQQVGAITEEQRVQSIKEAIAALHELAAGQSTHQDDENPALRFRALILDAIACGRAHVTNLDGVSAPENPGAWGWQLGRDVPLAERDSEGGVVGTSRTESWRSAGERIGQVHPKHPDVLLLDPGPALDAVRALAARRGNAFPFSSPRELGARLAKAGLLAESEIESREVNTKRIRVAGRIVERLWLALDVSEEVVLDESL